MTKKISKRTTKGRSKTRRSRGGKKTKKSYRLTRKVVKKIKSIMKGGERCFDRYGDIDSYGGLYDEDGDRNLNCPNKRDYDDDHDDDDDYNTRRYGK
jgi:hypothetical protein